MYFPVITFVFKNNSKSLSFRKSIVLTRLSKSLSVHVIEADNTKVRLSPHAVWFYCHSQFSYVLIINTLQRIRVSHLDKSNR